MKKIFYSCIVGMGMLCTQQIQAQTIHLKRQKTSLSTVLHEITKQTGYVFIYDADDLEKTTLKIDFDKAKLSEVLDYCKSFIPFNYKIVGKNVVLQFTNQNKQNSVYHGKVETENNQPLADVAIYVPKTNSFIFSNNDGEFTLKNVQPSDSVYFDLVGYQGLKTILGNNSNAFYLPRKSNDLDEVQVLAYGQQTNRKLNTGSVVKITAEDIEKTATIDPIQALQGRVAGLDITPNSGMAGANSSISLRGFNSMGLASNGVNSTGYNTPLFIVDGIPFNNESLTNANIGTMAESPFASIPPGDIKSIEILKDADATAIYGARGANGVILITTKKNHHHGLQFSVDASTTFQHIRKFPTMMNTSQYLEMRREGFANSGDEFDASSAPDVFTWDTTQSHNWAKDYFNKTAQLNNANVSVSGGNANNSFMLGGNFAEQSTVYNSKMAYKRGGFFANGTHTSKNGKLNINANVNYTTDKNQLITLNLESFVELPPDFNMYNSDGSYNWDLNLNPLSNQANRVSNKTQSLTSSLAISYDILPNLTFKINGGYNYMKMTEDNLFTIASQNPSYIPTGNHSTGNNHNATLNIEPQLNFEKYFGKNHFAVLLGGTYMHTSRQMNSTSATGFIADSLLNDFSQAQAITYNKQEGTYKFLSSFARLSYDYDSKYVINITGRRDGSSRFAPSYKYGNFGSIGAAWNFSDEKFFEPLKKVVSFAKLRGSYGVTGNDQIGDYAYYINYTYSYYPYQNQYGYYPTNLYNNNYHWESNRKLDLGMELGFVNNRIYLTADYYRNVTNNSLVGMPLPSFVGQTSLTTNLNARIQNTGLEFTIKADIIKSRIFTWSANGNITMSRNKLISFPGLENSTYKSSFYIGKSINSITGYKDPKINNQDGSLTVDDINKDGVISYDGDYTYLGSQLPAFMGGLGNTFSYKNWSFNAFFSFKHQAYNQVFTFYPGTTMNSPAFVYNNIWQKAGDNKKFPKAESNTLDPSYGYFNSSLAAYYSSSFVRLQSASLSYTLPMTKESFLKKSGFSHFNIYVMGNNLFTWTSNPGFDPETGLSIPNLRSFTFGIRTSFK